MRHFWNWVKDASGERTLYLNGPIASETWWGDEITPEAFRRELNAGSGDIIIWINSPGGDIEAASQIYNMLKEYVGKITVKIDGIAASAASIIAMAGDEVLMSPVSMMMIHNPSTVAIGDAEEMQRTRFMLDEYKEAIINAYALKTALPRDRISQLMDDETWMNAQKAIEFGFANAMLFAEELEPEPEAVRNSFTFSRAAVMNSLIDKHGAGDKKPKENTGIPIETLDKRLSLIIH